MWTSSEKSAALAKLAEYQAHAAQAGFRVVLLDSHVRPHLAWINETFNDPTWRGVVRDVRFRQALSLAINRPAINNGIYAGLASMPLQTVGTTNLGLQPITSQHVARRGWSGRQRYGRLSPGAERNTVHRHTGSWGTCCGYPARGGIDRRESTRRRAADAGEPDQPIRMGTALGWQMNCAATVMWSNDRGLGHRHHSWQCQGVRACCGGRSGAPRTVKQGEEPPNWIKQIIDLAAQMQGEIPGSPEYNQLYENALAWASCEPGRSSTLSSSAKQPLIVSRRFVMSVSGFTIAANFAAEQLFYLPRIYLPLVCRE